MAATITKDVLIGKDAKHFASIVDINYAKPDLKDKLFDMPDDDFLLITKSIGSKITIIDVKLVDDDFISSMLKE